MDWATSKSEKGSCCPLSASELEGKSKQQMEKMVKAHVRKTKGGVNDASPQKLKERQLTNIVKKVILEHDTAPNGNPHPPHRHSSPKTKCRHLTCCDKSGNPMCPAGTPKSCPDNNNGYTFPVALGSNGKCERGTSSRGGCCCNCNTGTSSPKSGGGCPELSHIKPWNGPCDGKGCEKACQGFSTNESRTLKTTQTINESEINKMRTMFNRMNSTGKNYNPARS
tara:strand:+ start:27 stop:698 length:672 start_codon:yes stop_codon:yes gene_type:complete